MYWRKRIEKRWREVPVDRAGSARLARDLRCSPVLADLLVGRGIASPEAAMRFLEPTLQDLHDPDLMPGIDRAVDRIARAVAEREPIAVFGDYDVDGVSSTALLLDFFASIRCPATHYIPRRLDEGYGLNSDAVRSLAAGGIRLIITVDNGSSSVEEIELARSLGVDVVVTDHHLPADPPPEPFAFVNPWLPGSRYPFPELSGAGVALKLVWAICRRFSRSRKVSPEFKTFMVESLALVALGTICDVVPLLGENRILAHFGLRALRDARRPGLRALVAMAARKSRDRLESRDVAFRIGPCLNSAGRLGEADLALRLLTTSDPAEADELVRTLVRENERRREIEKEIHEQARAAVLERFDLETDRALVVAGEGWHPGVIGIVASRLVDEFHRPTLLISVDGEVGKGSARSIPQVQIRDVLERASACLDGFGGHARAAGVRLAAGRVDELRERMNRAIEVAPAEMVPEIEIDGVYDLGMWTPEVIRDLGRMAPFGEGNREPLFASHGVDVVGVPRLMGREGAHLSFYARRDGRAVRAVAFDMGELHPEIVGGGARLAMVYHPVLSRWRDEERIELFLREVKVESR